MYRIKKTEKRHDRLDRYDKKKRYSAKRGTLREEFVTSENVLGKD